MWSIFKGEPFNNPPNAHNTTHPSSHPPTHKHESQSFLNLPTDSAFKQQRLPAWQPVLTARTVLPTFFVIGVLFIPIGVVLLYLSNSSNELIIDYTRCMQVNSNRTCADFLEDKPGDQCECKINFNLTEDFIASIQWELFNSIRLHNAF